LEAGLCAAILSPFHRADFPSPYLNKAFHLRRRFGFAIFSIAKINAAAAAGLSTVCGSSL
jgi:hypothetical protein